MVLGNDASGSSAESLGGRGVCSNVEHGSIELRDCTACGSEVVVVERDGANVPTLGLDVADADGESGYMSATCAKIENGATVAAATGCASSTRIGTGSDGGGGGCGGCTDGRFGLASSGTRLDCGGSVVECGCGGGGGGVWANSLADATKCARRGEGSGTGQSL